MLLLLLDRDCATIIFVDGMHNRIHYIARQLRRKYAEIIRKHHEHYTQQKVPAIFPEIFIEGGEVLHEGAKVKRFVISKGRLASLRLFIDRPTPALCNDLSCSCGGFAICTIHCTLLVLLTYLKISLAFYFNLDTVTAHVGNI